MLGLIGINPTVGEQLAGLAPAEVLQRVGNRWLDRPITEENRKACEEEYNRTIEKMFQIGSIAERPKFIILAIKSRGTLSAHQAPAGLLEAKKLMKALKAEYPESRAEILPQLQARFPQYRWLWFDVKCRP